MIRCKRCNIDKLETEYHIRSNKTRNLYCKSCFRTMNREKYSLEDKEIREAKWRKRANQVRKELHLYKQAIGCLLCCENDPRCLDFHHKDPKLKIKQVPVIWARFGKTAGLKEAAKCDVLCANCHIKHHCQLYIVNEELACIGENI